MKSAATALASMYGLKTPTQPVQQLITCLLHTLNAANLLPEAVQHIEQLTPLDVVEDELPYISSMTKLPEMVGLSGNPKALHLIIELLPYTLNAEEYEIVNLDPKIVTGIINRSGKGHVYAELRKLLKQINAVDLGYKVVQTPRKTSLNEFHIIKYTTKEQLISILTKHDLMTPSVLDRILT